jgi:hypothetical protein
MYIYSTPFKHQQRLTSITNSHKQYQHITSLSGGLARQTCKSKLHVLRVTVVKGKSKLLRVTVIKVGQWYRELPHIVRIGQTQQQEFAQTPVSMSWAFVSAAWLGLSSSSESTPMLSQSESGHPTKYVNLPSAKRMEGTVSSAGARRVDSTLLLLASNDQCSDEHTSSWNMQGTRQARQQTQGHRPAQRQDQNNWFQQVATALG